VGVVAEHASQLAVGARLQALDRRQAAADEERFEHHLIPGLLGKVLDGIGITVGHRLEDVLHVAAHTVGRARQVALGMRIERQAAQQRHLLAEIGAAQQTFEAPRHGIGIV